MVDFKKLREDMERQRQKSPEQQEKERQEKWARMEAEYQKRDEILEASVNRLIDDVRLNDWEKKFISDMKSKFKHSAFQFFSDNQIEKIRSIDNRYSKIDHQKNENKVSSETVMPNQHEEENNAENERQKHQGEGGFDDDPF